MNQINLYGFGSVPDSLGDASKTTSVIAAGASTAASLTEEIPGVNAITRALALLSSGIASLTRKSAVGKANLKSVQAQQVDLKNNIFEADQLITQGNANKASIASEINRLGIKQPLNGLNGKLGTWIKKTLTPQTYYAKEVNKATATTDQLQKELDGKIGVVQQIVNDLNNLKELLLTGKTAGLPNWINNLLPDSLNPTTKKVIVYGSGGLLLATTLYFLLRE